MGGEDLPEEKRRRIHVDVGGEKLREGFKEWVGGDKIQGGQEQGAAFDVDQITPSLLGQVSLFKFRYQFTP